MQSIAGEKGESHQSPLFFWFLLASLPGSLAAQSADDYHPILTAKFLFEFQSKEINMPTSIPNCYRVLLLALASIVFVACSTPTVSDADPTADFSSYETYAFLSDVADDKAPYETLERSHLKTAVGREMNARGYRQDSSNPDLLVNFMVETQEKLQSRTVPTGGYGIGYDPFYDVYTPGWGMSHTTRIDQFTEGTLEIDLIDVADRKMIWQGRTKGRLTESDMRNYKTTLDEAVSEIFEQFPVAR